MSKECPKTGTYCHDTRCGDHWCELQNLPSEKTWDKLMKEFQNMPWRWSDRPDGSNQDTTIAHLAAAVDRLTKSHEPQPANKPILVLTTLINKSIYIMPDITLTFGATPKGDGVFTLIDSVTGAILTGVTFSGQTVGANSNPAAATFALDPADATNNSVLPTPLAAGTGTIAFSTLANYTDSTGKAQTSVAFSIVKNFTVLLGADNVSFDVVFP